MSDLDRWTYPDVPPRPFGEATSYHRAYDFLAGCKTVEDWGCAMAYGRQFFPEGVYRGIDGSRHAAQYADEIRDLATYLPDPKPEGIVVRHVLEHNWDWQDILGNAVESFTRKLCLITFVPFGERTGKISDVAANGLVLSFRKDDITAYFQPFLWSEETLVTDTQFRQEHLFYVEKPAAVAPSEVLEGLEHAAAS